jgi:hypothetical protein
MNHWVKIRIQTNLKYERDYLQLLMSTKSKALFEFRLAVQHMLYIFCTVAGFMYNFLPYLLHVVYVPLLLLRKLRTVGLLLAITISSL